MKIERQLTWPCQGCIVRETSFCSALMGHTTSNPSATQKEISQIFVTAGKHEAIPHHNNGKILGPFILCKGWAYRYHRFSDRRRQILSVLIPGDLFYSFTLANAQPDFSVQSATEIAFCEFGRDNIRKEIATNSSAFTAFGDLCSFENRESTEAAVNLNEHDPVSRVANFMHRLVKRLAARGIRISAGVYPFSLTHIEIADAIGLTPDNVARVIQILRENNIANLSDNELTILDSTKFENHLPLPDHHASIKNTANAENWLS